MQATGDEAASFCFNILDAGRRGLVHQDSFVTATQGCAALALALPQQPGTAPNSAWAQATAAGDICKPLTALPVMPTAGCVMQNATNPTAQSVCLQSSSFSSMLAWLAVAPVHKSHLCGL